MAVAVTVLWHAKPGCEQQVEALLRTMQERTRAEPGCRHYYVHRMEEPTRFLLYEQYVSDDAVTAHHATEHYRRLVQGEAPALIESREIIRGETI